MKLFNQSFSKYFAKGEGIRAFFFLLEKTFQQFQSGVSASLDGNRSGNRDPGSSTAVAARLSTLTRWPEILWEGWSKAV